jgi:hypothetical protein
MAQITSRFGAVPNVGTTYVIVGAAVPASTTWNMLLEIVNRTAAPIAFRAFIAASSWTTGEPLTTDLISAICYDTPLTAGQVFQVPFIVVKTTEKIVVRSSVANSADVMASGYAIT